MAFLAAGGGNCVSSVSNSELKLLNLVEGPQYTLGWEVVMSCNLAGVSERVLQGCGLRMSGSGEPRPSSKSW